MCGPCREAICRTVCSLGSKALLKSVGFGSARDVNAVLAETASWDRARCDQLVAAYEAHWAREGVRVAPIAAGSSSANPRVRLRAFKAVREPRSPRSQ